jgi:hypothetical protein
MDSDRPQNSSLLIWLFTWPYHWTFMHYNVFPSLAIANATSSDDNSQVIRLVDGWRRAKVQELQYVKVAVSEFQLVTSALLTCTRVP